ncbi:hypothetical protein HY491_02320 [Candidatus Woesearchaeota archaeon]|nr:hypothetical protein [Candidatus Woesearchaeota archaeon]
MHLILLCLALIAACGKNPAGIDPRADVVASKHIENRLSYVEVVDYRDTPDRELDAAAASRIAAFSSFYYNGAITPNTMSYQGKLYWLGMTYRYTKIVADSVLVELVDNRTDPTRYQGFYHRETVLRKVEYPTKKELDAKLSWVSFGDQPAVEYVPLPRYTAFFGYYAVDVVDVPETPELLERLKAANENPWMRLDSVRYEIAYLKNQDGTIIHSPTGEKMVNGITVRALGSSSGSSSTDHIALYFIAAGIGELPGKIVITRGGLDGSPPDTLEIVWR